MNLDRKHHISRHVPYKKQLKDNNGEPIGVLPQAFEMREIDKKRLSVNWLEYFKSNHTENIIKMVKAFRKSRIALGYKAGLNSIFVIGNIGKLIDVCTSYKHSKVRVVHNPDKESEHNKSHASIHRLPENDGTIMQAMANEVFTEMVRNKDIK